MTLFNRQNNEYLSFSAESTIADASKQPYYKISRYMYPNQYLNHQNSGWKSYALPVSYVFRFFLLCVNIFYIKVVTHTNHHITIISELSSHITTIKSIYCNYNNVVMHIKSKRAHNYIKMRRFVMFKIWILILYIRINFSRSKTKDHVVDASHYQE